MPTAVMHVSGVWALGFHTDSVPAFTPYPTALNDADIGTYVVVFEGTATTNELELNLDDVDGLIPDSAVITGVRGHADVINVTGIDDGDGSFLAGAFRDSSAPYGYFLGQAFLSQYQDIDIGTAASVYGPWLPTRYGGGVWTKANLNNLRVAVSLEYPYDNPLVDQRGHLYHLTVEVQYVVIPTVNVTAPVAGSTVQVGAPTIAWDYAQADGKPQTAWVARVFTQAQFSAGGFNPVTSAAYWEQVTLGGAHGGDTTVKPTGLPNGVYRAYVFVACGPFNGAYLMSAADYNEFTVLALPIAPPVLRAIPFPYTTERSLLLEVRGGQNLLSFDDSTFDVNTGSWITYAHSTLARTVAAGEFVSGIGGLKATSTGAGTSGGQTTNYAYTKVYPYEMYRARVKLKANAARTVFVSIVWVDDTNTAVGLTLDIAGYAVTAAGFTEFVTSAFECPPNATRAAIGVNWPAVGAGEIVYIDEPSLAPAQVANAVYDPPNNSFFEGGGYRYWTAKSNAKPPVLDAAGKYSGNYGLRLEAVAAGDMKYWLFPPGVGAAVDTFGGRWYTQRALIRAATVQRYCGMGYEARDKNGVVVGGDDGFGDGIAFTAGHALIQRTFYVPPTAVGIYPYVIVFGCNANEQHWMDEFVIFEAADLNRSAWGQGGVVPQGVDWPGSPRYETQVSHDGGVTWESMPWVDHTGSGPSALQLDRYQAFAIWDYTVPPNRPVRYRSRAIVDGVGGTIYSEWTWSDDVTISSTTAFLKDPYTATSVPVTLVPSFAVRNVEPQTVHYPLGRDAAVVTSEGFKGQTFDLHFRTLNRADRETFEAITRTGRPLVLVNTLGQVWWVKLLDGGSADLGRAAPISGDVGPIRDYYEYAFSAVEVVPPDQAA